MEPSGALMGSVWIGFIQYWSGKELALDLVHYQLGIIFKFIIKKICVTKDNEEDSDNYWKWLHETQKFTQLGNTTRWASACQGTGVQSSTWKVAHRGPLSICEF